jgi:hypothetical protein
MRGRYLAKFFVQGKGSFFTTAAILSTDNYCATGAQMTGSAPATPSNSTEGRWRQTDRQQTIRRLSLGVRIWPQAAIRGRADVPSLPDGL